MRLCAAAFVAALLAVVLSSSPARAWNIVAAIFTPAASHSAAGPGVAAGGGAALTGGAAIVGGAQAGLTVAIIWCANNQPRRNLRRDTWVDGRHDIYPTYNSRADGCLLKGKRKGKRGSDPISARG